MKKLLLLSLAVFTLFGFNLNASEIVGSEIEVETELQSETVDAIETDITENKELKAANETKTIGNAPVISGLTDIYVEIGGALDIKKGVTVWDEEDGDITSSLKTGKVYIGEPGEKFLDYFVFDSDGNRTSAKRKIIVLDTKTTTYKGEKLVTFYDANGKRYKAELFYTTGEKHADYTYNSNGSWIKYVEYHKNGNKKDYQVRYDNLKLKERASYHQNGQLKSINNYYENGRKSMYRTWDSKGIKTDYQTYYNNTNNSISSDYAYYSNGKVKEFIKRYDNGRLKERAWYYTNSNIKQINNYYNNGRLAKIRQWGSNGVKTDHREYYNQANQQIKADYAYYDTGKVSEFIKWKSDGKRIEHVWIYKNGNSDNYKRIKRYDAKGKLYSDKSYKDKTLGYPADSVGALGIDGCKKMINEDFAAAGSTVDLTGETDPRPILKFDNGSINSTCRIREGYKGPGRGRAYVVANNDGTYDIGWEYIKW